MKLYQIKVPANGFRAYNVKADGIKDAVNQTQACLQNGKDSDSCLTIETKFGYQMQMIEWDIDILQKDWK